MTNTDKPLDAGSTPASVDVSPESIAALVAQGASALQELPSAIEVPDALPDALPLLVGITHDLRSPLSSMLVLIERLRAGHAGPVTPTQERQLGLLYSAAFGVASLTNDALDIARGSARELGQLRPAPLSVGDVWRAVRGLVQPIAEEKQLLLRWSGPAHDHRVGHAPVVHRVMLNLVTNALKFTTNGSVTVMVEEVNDSTLRVSVSDTGEGLPDVVRRQLARTDGAASPGTVSSAGLGIAMCQQMLAVVGSRLEDWSVSTRPGATLGFCMTLPRHDAPGAAQTMTTPPGTPA